MIYEHIGLSLEYKFGLFVSKEFPSFEPYLLLCVFFFSECLPRDLVFPRKDKR